MKAGYFSINEYLEKLNEEAQGGQIPDKEGMVIPPENQKAYQWLKKEYQKAQTEVKVEINMGGAKFEPAYDLQTDLKSVKDFKPGMYGEVKTAETKDVDNKKEPQVLDTNKGKPNFQKGEGEKPTEKEEDPKKDFPKEKTLNKNSDINKDKGKEEGKEGEEKEEKEDKEDSTKVKKLDLKTTKK